MINGELTEFRYVFSQTGLGRTGFEDEPQYIEFRALDGVAGRFYQFVLSTMGEEKYWSFTDPEDIAILLRKFISMADRIDEE